MGVLGIFLKVLGTITQVLQVAAPVAEIAGQVMMPGQKSGEFKLQIVRQSIRQGLLTSELLMGREIVDENLLDSAISDFASGAAKIEKATRSRT